MSFFIANTAIKQSPGSLVLSKELKENLVLVINEFIEGKIDINIAKEKTLALCGNCDVIQYVDDVLRTRFDPIPKQQFQNDLVTFRKKHGGSWTDYEDKRLLMAAEMYKPPNWAEIASFVGSRNKYQCAQRWERTLNPSIIQDPWTNDEDKRLIQAIKKYGLKAWHEVAKIVGTRTDVQCRYHYKNTMTKNDIKRVQRIIRKENRKTSAKPQIIPEKKVQNEIPQDPLGFFDKLALDESFFSFTEFF